MKRGDINYYDLIWDNEMYQYLKYMHNSVKQYVSKDQCWQLQNHT